MVARNIIACQKLTLASIGDVGTLVTGKSWRLAVHRGVYVIVGQAMVPHDGWSPGIPTWTYKLLARVSILENLFDVKCKPAKN